MRRAALALLVLGLAGCRDRRVAPLVLDKAPLLLFEHENFGGRSVPVPGATPDLGEVDFNDRASSMKVRSGWRVTLYEDSAQGGAFITYTCPPVPPPKGGYCEIPKLGELGVLRHDCSDKVGCAGFWNDKPSSVGAFGTADPHMPAGVLNMGRE